MFFFDLIISDKLCKLFISKLHKPVFIIIYQYFVYIYNNRLKRYNVIHLLIVKVYII